MYTPWRKHSACRQRRGFTAVAQLPVLVTHQVGSHRRQHLEPRLESIGLALAQVRPPAGQLVDATAAAGPGYAVRTGAGHCPFELASQLLRCTRKYDSYSWQSGACGGAARPRTGPCDCAHGLHARSAPARGAGARCPPGNCAAGARRRPAIPDHLRGAGSGPDGGRACDRQRWRARVPANQAVSPRAARAQQRTRLSEAHRVRDPGSDPCPSIVINGGQPPTGSSSKMTLRSAPSDEGHVLIFLPAALLHSKHPCSSHNGVEFHAPLCTHTSAGYSCDFPYAYAMPSSQEASRRRRSVATVFPWCPPIHSASC